jgi:hypothetical protein
MSGLRAGYGEAVITPPLGVELSGYGFYLERRATGVLDDLKARAVVLDDGRTRLVLTACDLIGLTVDAADDIRTKIARLADVPVAQTLLSCTHTHTGPASQPLAGIGEVDPAYMKRLPSLILEAAGRALSDVRGAELAFAAETLEPIGYNRRTGEFSPLDPTLAVGCLRRETGSVFLLNYACHAVVLGRSPLVSADWPGAAVRAVEARGHKAVFFQGFCGDVDPVANRNRWGAGDADDLKLYGAIVADRAAKSAGRASYSADVRLRVAEERIRVPLAVPPLDRIPAETQAFLEANSGFPRADRFAAAWEKEAQARHAEILKRPYLDQLPVQALALGDMRVIALPGEIFTAYGLKLRASCPALFCVGYANGNSGYWPPREAFRDRRDYGCYAAPKFYALFPFTGDLEGIVLDASRRALAGVA